MTLPTLSPLIQCQQSTGPLQRPLERRTDTLMQPGQFCLEDLILQCHSSTAPVLASPEDPGHRPGRGAAFPFVLELTWISRKAEERREKSEATLLFYFLPRAPDKSIDSLFSKVFPAGFLCEVELGPFPVKLPVKVKLFQQFSPFVEPSVQNPLRFHHSQQLAEHLKSLSKLFKAATSVCHLPLSLPK